MSKGKSPPRRGRLPLPPDEVHANRVVTSNTNLELTRSEPEKQPPERNAEDENIAQTDH